MLHRLNKKNDKKSKKMFKFFVAYFCCNEPTEINCVNEPSFSLSNEKNRSISYPKQFGNYCIKSAKKYQLK